ncbi:MAG: hypothetical protein ACYCT3_09160 [Acidiferrobacter sp.]
MHIRNLAALGIGFLLAVIAPFTAILQTDGLTGRLPAVRIGHPL